MSSYAIILQLKPNNEALELRSSDILPICELAMVNFTARTAHSGQPLRPDEKNKNFRIRVERANIYNILIS